MQKKMILVGLSNCSLGWEFFKAVLDSLERYSVAVTHTDCVRLRFETEHTKTWFFFKGDRFVDFDGIRPDAVFGSQWKMCQYFTSSNTFIGPEEGVGLVDYICKVEREAEDEYRRINKLCVADMYPSTLFSRPLSETEKRLYRRILNATYGKYGTFSSKPKILDPGFFKHEEIKPLAEGKNLDGLVKLYHIDEWDSYKESVMTATWPKTNPYLMSKEDVEQTFDEARKNDVFKINRLGKWHYKAEDVDVMKAMNQLDFYRSKYINMQIHEALMKGENNMNAVYNDLANGKAAYLVTDNGKVPVKIENLTTQYKYGCTVMNFEGRMSTLDDPIWRYSATKKKIAPTTKLPGIKTVHFSGPVTVVIWDDKTKTVVRCNNENIDYEKGLAMAIAKKALGTNKSGSNYYDIFKKYLPEDKEEPKKKKEAKTEEKPKKKKTTKGDKQNG